MANPDDKSTVIETFVTQFRKDIARGQVRNVRNYLELFPGDADTIATEFIRLQEESGSDTPREGRFVGHYKILKELGRGGQGLVYLAEDTNLRRRVALKVLTEYAAASDAAVQRFRREAELASKLNHPGICAIHETGLADGLPYIAMQLVQGKSLVQMISDSKRAQSKDEEPSLYFFSELTAVDADDEPQAGPPPPEETSSTPTSSLSKGEIHDVLKMMEKTARALHAAHSIGIIHRDIKPGNIMITPSGESVILDFGLARAESDELQTLTRTGDFLGTPAYMSPEQLMGHHLRIDGRTDVYSLAVTLYECLTLKRPFEAPTRESLYQAIMTREPEDPRRLNPKIPKDLGIVLSTALEKDRDRRYQTALDFAEDLRRVRTFEPIVAKPVPLPTRAIRWAQRKPALATAIAGVFLLLATGLVITLWFLGETRDALTNEAAARRETEKERDGVFRLRASQTLKELQRQADEDLWPITPSSAAMIEDRLQQYDLWLSKARTLIAELDQGDPAKGILSHRAQLQAVRARAVHTSNPSEMGGRRLWSFASQDDAWWNSQLEGLIEKLERFGGPRGRLEGIDPTTGWGVQRRRDFLAGLESQTLVEPKAAWREVRQRIQGNAAYSGLTLEPQLGLVPLGPDPESKLEEFWDPSTGSRPLRDPESRQLTMTVHSGLVFVLIPGGSFFMGAQKADPSVANHDRQAMEDESPVHEVTLAPFFISKFEISQAQWSALVGVNSANYQPGSKPSGTPATAVTALHPMEDLSWTDCANTLPRFSLQLPTEAQWEYACRAGTSTVWWTGTAPESIDGAVNVADAAAVRNGSVWSELRFWPGSALDDGYAWTSPIGRFRANAFGLHDVHGNVFEWCRDARCDYRSAPRARDGLRSGNHPKLRMLRGGSFRYHAAASRSAHRDPVDKDFRNNVTGLRPARAIRQN